MLQNAYIVIQSKGEKLHVVLCDCMQWHNYGDIYVTKIQQEKACKLHERKTVVNAFLLHIQLAQCCFLFKLSYK